METLAVHGGERRPGPEGAAVFPVYTATVFANQPGQAYHDLKYNRLSTNPTQVYLNDKLAALEGAGSALATASGMAACTSILFSFLRPGDHLLLQRGAYGGTHDFITRRAADHGWTYSLVDPQRPGSLAEAITPQTKLLVVETISNPLMRVPPLDAVAAVCRERGILSVIDNTFATPVNFRPLDHGFDLVFHSATKYLNGHSDLVAGVVLGRNELMDKVRHTLNLHGGTIDPRAAGDLARGMKTLALRVRAQNDNALALARFLSGHAKVAEVNYAGLEESPDHKHAAALLAGVGGMLSFRPEGGVEAADRILAALTIPFVAPSLGGVESLVTRPVLTSHAGLSEAERFELGIAPDLVRVSVGIEAREDLIEDFERALG